MVVPRLFQQDEELLTARRNYQINGKRWENKKGKSSNNRKYLGKVSWSKKRPSVEKEKKGKHMGQPNPSESSEA